MMGNYYDPHEQISKHINHNKDYEFKTSFPRATDYDDFEDVK
jgi:hypothetical protein